MSRFFSLLYKSQWLFSSSSHHHKLKMNLSRRYSRKDSAVTLSPSDTEKDLPKLSILKPVLKTFGCELFYAGLLKMAASVITFVNPVLLEWVLVLSLASTCLLIIKISLQKNRNNLEISSFNLCKTYKFRKLPPYWKGAKLWNFQYKHLILTAHVLLFFSESSLV